MLQLIIYFSSLKPPQANCKTSFLKPYRTGYGQKHNNVHGAVAQTDKAYLSVVIERREGQLQTLMYPKEGRNPQINCHQLCIAPTSGLEECLQPPFHSKQTLYGKLKLRPFNCLESLGSPTCNHFTYLHVIRSELKIFAPQLS